MAIATPPMLLHRTLPLALCVLAAGQLSAQSFNVDFKATGVLPSGYAAAGSAGVWNSVTPPALGAGVPLVDTLGSATAVTLRNQAINAGFSTASDPTVTGLDGELLLDGYTVTDIPGIMRFEGLQPGVYDVIAYGFVPSQPTFKTSFISLPVSESCGGLYSGALVEGITHVRQLQIVTANGELRIDWVIGGPFGSFCMFSGVQIARCGPAPFVYCTAKPNSLGCTPQIGFIGAGASLSDALPFTLTAQNVLNAKNGLFFYSTTGAAVIPFLGGTLCGNPPLRRTPIQNAGGATPPANDCSGSFSFDFNAWLQGGNDPLISAGTTANGQFWSRDPADPAGAGLTDAVELTVCP